MLHLHVTLLKPDEVDELEAQLQALHDLVKIKDREISRLSQYAELNLRYLDIINEARRRLVVMGEDVSWIDVK